MRPLRISGVGLHAPTEWPRDEFPNRIRAGERGGESVGARLECVDRDEGRTVGVPGEAHEEDADEDVDEGGELDLRQRFLEVGTDAALFLRQRRR